MGSKKTARKPVWAPWDGKWNVGWFPEHRLIPQYWGWIGIPDVGMEGCGVCLWGETVLGTALSARPAFCRTWSRGHLKQTRNSRVCLTCSFFPSPESGPPNPEELTSDTIFSGGWGGILTKMLLVTLPKVVSLLFKFAVWLWDSWAKIL